MPSLVLQIELCLEIFSHSQIATGSHGAVFMGLGGEPTTNGLMQ